MNETLEGRERERKKKKRWEEREGVVKTRGKFDEAQEIPA